MERTRRHFLDGQALAFAYRDGLHCRRRGGHVSLDMLEYVGDEGEANKSRTEENGTMEKNKCWEGEIRAA